MREPASVRTVESSRVEFQATRKMTGSPEKHQISSNACQQDDAMALLVSVPHGSPISGAESCSMQPESQVP